MEGTMRAEWTGDLVLDGKVVARSVTFPHRGIAEEIVRRWNAAGAALDDGKTPEALGDLLAAVGVVRDAEDTHSRDHEDCATDSCGLIREAWATMFAAEERAEALLARTEPGGGA